MNGADGSGLLAKLDADGNGEVTAVIMRRVTAVQRHATRQVTVAGSFTLASRRQVDEKELQDFIVVKLGQERGSVKSCT